MTDDIQRDRLETEAIVVGYVMSRLDSVFLSEFAHQSWIDAYQSASKALNEPPMTFKNLRDEFDPFHSNSRLGWWKRPLRQSRQRVLDELAGVSDEALLELTRRILKRDNESTKEAIDSLAVVTKQAYNVAERLLTGRLAEEFFLMNSSAIVGMDAADIVDHRNAACGFDFSSKLRPDLAIEVKGIKDRTGSILFTDLEWSVAKNKNFSYLLVVVGNLKSLPQAVVVSDPFHSLEVACVFQQSMTATWRARVSVA